MKGETKKWISYAEENKEAAKVLLENDLFNPCLHNVQQCIEKSLKALFIENALSFKKTHSTLELKNILENNGISVGLDDDECDFLDSIYLPSKYPVASVLPDFYPDKTICINAVELADKVVENIKYLLK